VRLAFRKHPAAKVDFEEAAAHLPFSQDQAVARFKLADAQFFLKDYAGAASNYSLVLTLYDKMPEVTNALFDLALYQIAEADIHAATRKGRKGRARRWRKSCGGIPAATSGTAARCCWARI
jgi:hypothetical protein